ncbi:MAG: hypothetical protein AABW85_04075, partial [archaeon]
MKIPEKGQSVILDFSLAAFIFLIAFAALTVYWTSGISEKAHQSKLFEMNQKANIAAEMLSKSPGNPENWEEININDVNSIGLAGTENSVDPQKLNAFKNMDYGKARRLLNISEYDFSFDFNGTDQVTAGLPNS